MNSRKLSDFVDRRFRFSLRTLLYVSVLLPLSIGFVNTVDVGSRCIMDQLDYETIDGFEESIALKLGGLSIENRFIFITGATTHLLSGLVIGIVVLLLLLFRSPWFDRMALSLILTLPLWYLIVFWLPSLEPNVRTVLFFCKALIVLSVIASILIVFYVFLWRSFQKTAGMKIVAHANTQRWTLRCAVVAIYLSVSAYGWDEIRKFHAEHMAEWKVYSKSLKQADESRAENGSEQLNHSE